MGGKSESDQSSRQGQRSWLSPPSVVYWSRLGFAVLAGFVYTILARFLVVNDVSLGTAVAVALGILFYAVSVLLVRFVLGYGEADLMGPRKHVSLGMGTYIIWLIFTITILYTLYPPA